MIACDPPIHHRRSIRLKGHEYAGSGTYFVTICAHREFIQFAKGHPFSVGATRMSPSSKAGRMSPSSMAGRMSPSKATCVSPVREIIAEEWKRSGELRDDVFPGEFVVMPDHFHGLIRIRKGPSELGHVIGAFKAAASRRIRRGDDTHVVPFVPPPNTIRIWHRNYYEMIVRPPEAEESIAEYIRMNPWKLVQHATHEGQSFRMIGNPALLNREKIAMLCSRNAPADVLTAATKRAQNAGPQHCFISGFHSPPEKALLTALLRTGDTHVGPKLICCPAWGIDTMRIPQEWLPALEANRMLILEMPRKGDTHVAPDTQGAHLSGNLAAAEERNQFVMECAEKRWLPYISPGGMLDRLTRKGDTQVALSPDTHVAPDTQITIDSTAMRKQHIQHPANNNMPIRPKVRT